VLLVTVLCSDPACTEERELVVDELDGVDATVCECGHGFVVISVSEVEEAPRGARVVSLPARRRESSRRAA